MQSCSKQYYTFLLLSILFLNLFSKPLLAATSGINNIVKINNICKTSPNDCLSLVNEQLQNTPRKSRVWYSLLQSKLESLFLLQKATELNQLTKQFIDQEDLPIPFAINVYIYYAKGLYDERETQLSPEFIKQESKKYVEKVKVLLGLMNNAYPDPHLLIKLANIQMLIGEYQPAYKLLQSVSKRYPNYPDLMFNSDLYANLGHLADRLGYQQQAINHWLTSLKWVVKLNNNQQTATLYYNLARSQTTAKQVAEAKVNFKKAIHYSTLANDKVKTIEAQVAFTKLLLSLGKNNQAQAVYNSIIQPKNPKKFPIYINKNLMQLKQQLAIINQQ